MRPILILAFAIILLTACNNNSKPNSDVIATPTESSPSTVVNPDSVAFSFVFVGCNRIQSKDEKNHNTNSSTANVPELQRTFTEVCSLNPKPVFFFFLGDEVLGLKTKYKTLEDELKAWRKQYADTSFSPISQSGIQMIAIPGNHEMLFAGGKADKNGEQKEFPNSIAIKAWVKEMSSFIPDSTISLNRVTGSTSLVDTATYSFNYGDTHFIMINTDTYNKNETIGMAPAAWIVADIQKARADTSIKHIFLLGHKPAVVAKKLYKWDDEHTMDTSVVKAIWPVMDSNGVEAMLSAHSHQYNRIQPDSGMAYQVIAGNGGSLYEGDVLKGPIDHQFFGYTIVYVMKNGKVIVQSMGRTVPASNYLMSLTPADSTTVRDLVDISWGTGSGNYSPGQTPKKK